MNTEPLWYEELIIEAADLRDDGSFRVRVLSSPVGGMTSTSATSVACTWDELDSATKQLDEGKLEPGEIITFGRLLASLLLPECWVRTLFWRSLDRAQERGKGLRLRLRFEHPKLASVPWEYLYVDRGWPEHSATDFLALQRLVSITRNDVVSPMADLPPTVTQIHLLGAFASPTDQPKLHFEPEKVGIKKTVEIINHDEQAFRLTLLKKATRTDLLRALDQVDAFHFSGFGVPPEESGTKDTNSVSEPGILLLRADRSSDYYYASMLASALAGAGTRLAVMNATSLGPQTLQVLTRAGIPAAIGQHSPVSEESASQFSSRLYGHLALGYTIDEAVFRARQALFNLYGLDWTDWGKFILYLQARSGFLFPTPPEAAEDASEAPPLIRVRRRFGTVGGRVVGADVGDLSGLLDRTLLEINEQFDTVAPGGEVTGLQGRLAERKKPDPQLKTAQDTKPNRSTRTRGSSRKESEAMVSKPLVYRDFDIEMTDLKDDGTFKVRVIGNTPGGEGMRADEAETLKYTPDEYARLLGKLERRKGSQDELIQLGEKLTNLLLPGKVRDLYEDGLKALNEGEGLRLRLRIEPLELAALPWEYTYVRRVSGEKVPGDFLALQRRVSITRYEAIGSSLKPLEGKENIRIVAALAAPLDQDDLNLEADKRAIMAAIADLKAKAEAVEAHVLEEATRSRLLEAIASTDIFHFAGHGVFEGTELTTEGKIRKKGKIILETEGGDSDRYDSEQLAITLGNAGVRLVVMGACNSAARDEGGAWTGVAPALVRENIPAVVAMQYKVLDSNAGNFMAHLYTRVLGGYTIDEAVFEGRQALFNESGLEDRDWGVPVLYLRAEDGFLFPLPPTETAGGSEAPVVLVQRELGTVRGEDIGVEVGEMLGGRIEVRDKIDVVEKGGKTYGAKIDRLG